MTRPELRLDARTFRDNIRAVRARIEPSELMLVVKDDAYGHGLSWTVSEAERAGVSWFGSYDVRTALDVRRDVGGRVCIFAWATSTDEEIDEALRNGIDLGVGSAEYLDRVIRRAGDLGLVARVHLKIDTGLRRNGLLPLEWAAAVGVTRAAEDAEIVEFAGVWSHIAEASDAEDDEAQAVFLEAIRVAEEAGARPVLHHLTASAASWWRSELRGSLSRIGAFCYGVRSADGPDLEGIAPIASLVASVTRLDGDTAVVGIGSFDGLPSTLAGSMVGTPDGSRVLRRVDHTSCVVEGWPGMDVGDEVHLFGPGAHGEMSATTLAESIDTVGEEILTRLSTRVRRSVID